jgi:type I restriction enzyme M protein
MTRFHEKSNFLWSVADLIRDDFKRGKYQDVILPLTVLRRIDQVLEPTKDEVLAKYHEYRDKLDNLDPMLRNASGFAFYNTSPFTFERLLQDAPNLAANLRAYIAAFSPNMREVLEKFDFANTIDRLDQSGLLFLVMERFRNVDLHPDRVSNLEMGYVFEDLIRRFNEALNENPGEHFTPREVVRLMVTLMLAGEGERLAVEGIARTVCDPCCGTGGMLTVAQDRIHEINPAAHVHLFGQEVNPETFAVCKSDLYLKSADGRDAEGIQFGSTLSNDRFAGQGFDYLIANPPYGKDWKRDKDSVDAEAAKGENGRFPAGTPRISDGQLLFLQHMLTHMRPVEQGGGRVAIVMNGSPLFTGDAGSGESEIRRWVLENDWLDAIVALPEQLFYNTGIATYIWILTNRKAEHRRGRVQLIDATGFWQPMRKSLGDKRRQISDAHLERIQRIYEAFEEGEHSRIFATTDFGYRKIQVERPLKLNFQASAERIERLRGERAFSTLAESRKKDPQARAAEQEEGRRQQEEILGALRLLGDERYADRVGFEKALKRATEAAGIKVAAPLQKAVLSALSERDERAAVCTDAKANPEPDPDLRDHESVPLSERIEDFFAREVLPHVADAWINPGYTDSRDGEVGRVGYEINFNRYFYRYTPPRPLEEIEAEIKIIEGEILEMLQEVAG